MKFAFIGDPERDYEGPDVTEWQGVTFPKGQSVEVPDTAIPLLQGHSHFEQVDGQAQPSSEPAKDPEPDTDWQSQYTDEQLAWLERDPSEMSKDDLVAMGAAFGLELKKQSNHETLVNKIKAAVNGGED